MKTDWLACRFEYEDSEENEWRLYWVVANKRSICFYDLQDCNDEELGSFMKKLSKVDEPKKPLSKLPSFHAISDLKIKQDVEGIEPIKELTMNQVEIDVAEDEANHVSTFTISIDNEKVYCATGTSRRMFEWIFILRHLKDGIEIDWRQSLFNEAVFVPSVIDVESRRDSRKSLHTQFSSLFSVNLIRSQTPEQVREKWKNIIKKIIKMKTVTSAFESILGTSYSRVVIKSGYQLEKQIGQGAFGDVYKVKQQSSNKLFALKSFEKDSIPIVLDQYVNEKNVLSSISNEFRIINFYESFEDDDSFFLVLEYCPGGDLFSLLEQNIFPEETVKIFAAQIALAINAVHQQKYCHRDIKPDNFVFDENNYLKICDFGFCVALDDENSVNCKASVGTPEYIAPEVLNALHHNQPYGKECDWWSFGILVFEMFFGYTPFNTPNLLRTYSVIKDFKTYFNIPSKPEISEDACDFLRKLICESSSRLSFSEIKAHPFLSSVPWNDFENVTIPNPSTPILLPRNSPKPQTPPIQFIEPPPMRPKFPVFRPFPNSNPSSPSSPLTPSLNSPLQSQLSFSPSTSSSSSISSIQNFDNPKEEKSSNQTIVNNNINLNLPPIPPKRGSPSNEEKNLNLESESKLKSESETSSQPTNEPQSILGPPSPPPREIPKQNQLLSQTQRRSYSDVLKSKK